MDMSEKTSEVVPKQNDSQSSQDKEEIQRLRQLANVLELKLQEVTTEKEGLKLELTEERAAHSKLKDQLQVAGEELHQVNLVLLEIERMEFGEPAFGHSSRDSSPFGLGASASAMSNSATVQSPQCVSTSSGGSDSRSRSMESLLLKRSRASSATDVVDGKESVIVSADSDGSQTVVGIGEDFV